MKKEWYHQLCRIWCWCRDQTRDAEHVHQLWLEPVDEGAEGDAALPRGRQVRDGHTPVALRLLLAPGEQPRRSDLRLCRQNKKRRVESL